MAWRLAIESPEKKRERRVRSNSIRRQAMREIAMQIDCGQYKILIYAALPGHQSIFKLSERQAPERATPTTGPTPYHLWDTRFSDSLILRCICASGWQPQPRLGLGERLFVDGKSGEKPLRREGGCDGAAQQLHTHVNHTPRWPR